MEEKGDELRLEHRREEGLDGRRGGSGLVFLPVHEVLPLADGKNKEKLAVDTAISEKNVANDRWTSPE